MRDRAAIQQPSVTVGQKPATPLAASLRRHAELLGGASDRATLIDDHRNHAATGIQTESSVSVKLHPVCSLVLGCLAALSLQEAPDATTSTQEQRPQELQLAHLEVGSRPGARDGEPSGAA